MRDEVLSIVIRARDEATAHFAKIGSALGGVAEKADVAGRAMGGLHSILGGIGTGIGISAFMQLQEVIGRVTSAIPDLIDRGLKFADTVDTIQNATGASAEASSRLAGQLSYLGVNTDGLAMRMGILAKGIIAREGELNRLGVSVRDVNGRYLDGVTIVERVRSALAGMGDSVEKTKLATELFGRSGVDMIDWLKMSDAQMGVLNEQLDALGVTMSQTAVDEAKKAAREGNLLNLAMQGLANTLTANVAPALITAIDSIVAFVRDNGQAIAAFASQVVNFVLGMIAALTGASVQTVTFTDRMDAAGGAAGRLAASTDAATASTRRGAGASSSASAALTQQAQAVQRLIDRIRAQDAAQETAFQRQMGRLSAQMDAQLAQMDAADRALRIERDRERLADNVARAQAAIAAAATGSAAAQASAAQQLADAQQAQADYERGLSEQARRDEISTVKAKLAEIAKLESSSTDKVSLARTLKRREDVVQGQIAAAQEKGDAQAVADLRIVLEGIQTAEARTQQAARNRDREEDLGRQKAQIDELKRRIGGVGTAYKAVTPHLVDLGKSTAVVATAMRDHVSMVSGSVAGPAGSLKKSLDDARAAGEQAGKAIRDALAQVAGAVGNVVNVLGGMTAIINGIDKAKLGLAVMAAGVATGQPEIILAGAVLAGLQTAFGTGTPIAKTPATSAGDRAPRYGGAVIPGRAVGGPVDAGQPYRVGERGEETFVPSAPGTILPNGAAGGITVNIRNEIAPGPWDPMGVGAQQAAQQIMAALQREITRQFGRGQPLVGW